MIKMESTKGVLVRTLSQLEKKYGEGIVMRMGDTPKQTIPTISTGSFTLDYALGTGGYPLGRIIEIFGPESSGKTTLAMHAIAESQHQGGTALLVDTEHAFDRVYANKIGLDTDNLLICQPSYGEQALDIVEQCINSNEINIVVIDSVSALLPEAELKGDMGSNMIGGQARLMSRALRKLAAIISKKRVVCLFINQIRHKIGVFFGSPEVTSGGNALKFYASARIDMRVIQRITDKENNKIGQRVRVKVVKNKLAAPFQEAQFNIYYGQGIDKKSEILDLSLSLQLLKNSGSWFYHGDTKLGQGKEAVLHYFDTHPELLRQLTEEIKAKRQDDHSANPNSNSTNTSNPD